MDRSDVLILAAVGLGGYFLYQEFANQGTATVTEGPDPTPTTPPPVSTIPTQDPNGEEIPANPYPPAPTYPNYDHIIAGGNNVMSTSPMGMRYNNPGNLRPNNREAHYPTMQAGILAALNNLIAYQHLHNLNTIRGIISRWAPPNENDTTAYINYVSQQTGIGPDQQINASDPSTAYRILMAIFSNENGGQTPSASLVRSVVSNRLGQFA